MADMYRLDGTTPAPASGDEAAAALRSDRRVRFTVTGGVTVSTSFLVLDHGYAGKPLLFETLVSGGIYNQHMDRYATWDEAVAGHEVWVARAQRPPFFWLGAKADADA